MKFISVTRLRLRSRRYLLAFLNHATASSQQAIAAPGNLLTITRQQRLRIFWTVTVWESETAMRQFMSSGAHRQAMPLLVEWCDQASTLHWWQEDTHVPDWRELELRMSTEGRSYPLRCPSSTRSGGEVSR